MGKNQFYPGPRAFRTRWVEAVSVLKREHKVICRPFWVAQNPIPLSGRTPPNLDPNLGRCRTPCKKAPPNFPPNFVLGPPEFLPVANPLFPWELAPKKRTIPGPISGPAAPSCLKKGNPGAAPKSWPIRKGPKNSVLLTAPPFLPRALWAPGNVKPFPVPLPPSG